MVKTLILCIDRDNDLYEKAKINGPVIGRQANLDAATKLALADPEDVDANAMFYAIKLYDSLSKKNKMEVITLTGHKSLGYKADREISTQLDRVIREFGSGSCVLVSDGASDEEIIPVIKSRLTIDSTKIVYVKQAKELEKTYYVILEKLKDPYYAKIVIGVPALLLLLFSFASYSGVGWQPFGILLGFYLLFFKGFGWEENIGSFISNLNFSFDRVSAVANFSAMIILVLAILVGSQAYSTATKSGFHFESLIAYILLSIIPLVLIGGLLIYIGKSVDAILDKRSFVVTRYSLYAIALVLISLIIDVGSNWILNLNPPYVSFSDFFFTIISTLIIAWISIVVINMIRIKSLLAMKLEGKEVINLNGSFIGRVVGVDGAKGSVILQNSFGKRISLSFDSVFSVTDQVVVKSFI
ncbi:MAG: DUF373 family protein [Candidatus Micrarchaeia archaeon]